jgi:hypothetical protein
MRFGLIVIAAVLGASQLWLGTWMLLNAGEMAKTLAVLKGGGFDLLQDLNVDSWQGDFLFTGSVLAALGLATLLSGCAIAVRWIWAWAVWLAAISLTTIFHMLWLVVDFRRGTQDFADVALTASIALLCVLSWGYLMRPTGRAALSSVSV